VAVGYYKSIFFTDVKFWILPKIDSIMNGKGDGGVSVGVIDKKYFKAKRRRLQPCGILRRPLKG
jgi:hypothetical protein